MKIEIDLPDWCDERHVFIIAGIELIAYKSAFEDTWHIKISRCVQCGKCCMNLPKGQYELDVNGDCVHLGQDGPNKRPCKLGAMMPFPCVEGDPEKGKWNDGFCSVRYKEV